MYRVKATYLIGICVAVLLGAADSGFGFNPQPEPPADQWGIEGFIDMSALSVAPTGPDMPFGVPFEIIGDSEIDFRAGIRASFTAPDTNGDLRPDDGVYPARTSFFNLVIGDTQWTHGMIVSDFDLELQYGLVTGVRGLITETLVGHPDLAFMFPASPGAWLATDERYGDNLGTLSGVYELRDGVVVAAVVPEPSSLVMLGFGVLMLLCKTGGKFDRGQVPGRAVPARRGRCGLLDCRRALDVRT